VSTLVGKVRNFGTMWYNPNSLTNILSLAQVCKQFWITMDTVLEASMSVHQANGSIMKFTEYQSGLYNHDTAISSKTVSNIVTGYFFIVTVAGNDRDCFHWQEIKGADCACQLYAPMCHPLKGRQ